MSTERLRITVNDFIVLASNMCGVNAVALSYDVSRQARQLFKMLLLHLANKGITLWSVEKQVLGMVPGVSRYALSSNTADYLDILYRQTFFASDPDSLVSSAGGVVANLVDGNPDTFFTQTSANGSITYDYGTTVYVTTVAVMANGQQYYNLDFETSLDAISWTPLFTTEKNTSFPDRKWVAYDMEDIRPLRYIRVAETGGTVLNLRQLLLGNSQNEITLSAANLDDYSAMSNKETLSEQPTLFWFDRKKEAPELVFWPTPNNLMRQVVAWTYREIEETADLAAEVDIPKRWYLAILNELALRMLFMVPSADMTRYQMIKVEAEATMREAASEEVDKAPMTLLPNISCYTR